MKTKIFVILSLLFFSCNSSKKEKKQTTEQKKVVPCNYIDDFKNVGNTIIDTIRIGDRIVDPIDNLTGFKVAKHNFLTKDGKLYKKAKTHRRCNDTFIDVEYF